MNIIEKAKIILCLLAYFLAPLFYLKKFKIKNVCNNKRRIFPHLTRGDGKLI